MVYVENGKVISVYTVSDMARVLVVTPAQVMYRIWQSGHYPQPDVIYGRKTYFSHRVFTKTVEMELSGRK